MTTQQVNTTGGIAGVTRNGGKVDNVNTSDVFMLIIQNMIDGMGENAENTGNTVLQTNADATQLAALGANMDTNADDAEQLANITDLLTTIFNHTSKVDFRKAITQLEMLSQVTDEGMQQALVRVDDDEDIDMQAVLAAIMAVLAQAMQNGQPTNDTAVLHEVQQAVLKITGEQITQTTASKLVQAAELQQSGGRTADMAAAFQDMLTQTVTPGAVTQNALATEQAAMQQSMATRDKPQALSADTGNRQTADKPADTMGSTLQQAQTSFTVTQRAVHNDQQSAYYAQNAFRDAIVQAKQQLRGAKETKDTLGELDIDALQAQVNAAKTTPLNLDNIMLKPTVKEGLQEASVLDQITTGITQNMKTGSSEFTMKLNPESLGEITVKLVENEGKTTLQIITASTETARMINSDITALREAVKPMEVQVFEAVTQAQQDASAQMHSFDMMNQQQTFAQQQGWRHTAHVVNEIFPEDEALEEELTLDAALDTYV